MTNGNKSAAEMPKVESLNAHIAEYNSLRTEVLTRLQSQSQAFNYLVTVLAASVGGITYLLKEGKPELISELGLFVPILVAPLAYIFFDNELMIFRNGFYIANYLQERVSEITKDKVFMLEQRAFPYLGEFNNKVHRLLSMGRWFLFIVPTIGPVVNGLASIDQWHITYIVIAAIDCILVVILLVAMYSVLRVHKIWASLSKNGAPPESAA